MLAFIDETGDHNLLQIDEQYPIFGLGALLITESEYSKMEKVVAEIKKEFFKDADNTFILHSSELKRPLDRRSDKRNIPMSDPAIRKRFYSEFDKRVIEDIDLRIIACFIIKKRMIDTYAYPADPYHFSFENLLNRIIRYGDDKNMIIAEKRGEQLDAELMSEYEKRLKIGIHSYSPASVAARTDFKLVPKADNVCGLQVIDLILSCLVRSGLGKGDKMIGNDLTPELVKSKYACPSTVFPRFKKKNI